MASLPLHLADNDRHPSLAVTPTLLIVTSLTVGAPRRLSLSAARHPSQGQSWPLFLELPGVALLSVCALPGHLAASRVGFLGFFFPFFSIYLKVGPK